MSRATYSTAFGLLTILWTVAVVTAFLIPSGSSAVTSISAVLYAIGGIGCIIAGAWISLGAKRA